MGEKKWHKLVIPAFVGLGIVLVLIGALLTEPGTEELAYGRSGTFSIEESHAGMSIIVFTDDVEANCENFGFSVDRHDGSYDFVPVEKTSCDRWSSPNSYQFRLNNLTEGRYGFSAEDWVSIVAVEGDLDAYMEDYASGNAIADLGAGMCCLSIFFHVFIGRGIAKARNAEHQVVVSEGHPTAVGANQPAIVQVVEPVESVSEEPEAPAGGAFWDNIAED